MESWNRETKLPMPMPVQASRLSASHSLGASIKLYEWSKIRGWTAVLASRILFDCWCYVSVAPFSLCSWAFVWFATQPNEPTNSTSSSMVLLELPFSVFRHVPNNKILNENWSSMSQAIAMISLCVWIVWISTLKSLCAIECHLSVYARIQQILYSKCGKFASEKDFEMRKTFPNTKTYELNDTVVDFLVQWW